jgi:predicted enzyme related to lactoylglutathione lyase
MPQPEGFRPGAPCWAELFTSDPDRARSFYGGLFGWTAFDGGPDYGGYLTFSTGDHAVAGGMRNDGQAGVPDAWSLYLATTDAKATVDAAVAHGGSVIVPAMDVMDLGTMAVLTDAGHAAVGAWEAGTHKGFGILGEPGAPAWFELHTREYDRAIAFYRDVFEWDPHTMSDTPEFRYTTLGEGDGALAGIMDASGFLPEGVPSAWRIYFGVADTDAAVQQVTTLGGAVLEPAVDTPYGRMATAADPTGAVFKVVTTS